MLCEKPLAPIASDAEAMFRAAGSAGVLLAEAWMTPFQPRWRRALAMAGSGQLGTIRHVRAEFTFTIAPSRAGTTAGIPARAAVRCSMSGSTVSGPVIELWALTERLGERHLGTDRRRTTTAAWCGWATAGRPPRSPRSSCRSASSSITGTAGRLMIDDRAHTGGAGATAIELVHGTAGARRSACPPTIRTSGW